MVSTNIKICNLLHEVLYELRNPNLKVSLYLGKQGKKNINFVGNEFQYAIISVFTAAQNYIVNYKWNVKSKRERVVCFSLPVV